MRRLSRWRLKKALPLAILVDTASDILRHGLSGGSMALRIEGDGDGIGSPVGSDGIVTSGKKRLLAASRRLC